MLHLWLLVMQLYGAIFIIIMFFYYLFDGTEFRGCSQNIRGYNAPGTNGQKFRFQPLYFILDNPERRLKVQNTNTLTRDVPILHFLFRYRYRSFGYLPIPISVRYFVTLEQIIIELLRSVHIMAGEWESSISFIYNVDRRQAPVSVPIDTSPVTETCRSMRSSEPPPSVTIIIQY